MSSEQYSKKLARWYNSLIISPPKLQMLFSLFWLPGELSQCLVSWWQHHKHRPMYYYYYYYYYYIVLAIRILLLIQWQRCFSAVVVGHWVFKLCLLVYKALNGLAPSYVTDMLQPVTTLDRQVTLRSADNNDLFISRSRVRLGERAFRIAAAQAWKSLPSDVKSA